MKMLTPRMLRLLPLAAISLAFASSCNAQSGTSADGLAIVCPDQDQACALAPVDTTLRPSTISTVIDVNTETETSYSASSTSGSTSTTNTSPTTSTEHAITTAPQSPSTTTASIIGMAGVTTSCPPRNADADEGEPFCRPYSNPMRNIQNICTSIQ